MVKLPLECLPCLINSSCTFGTATARSSSSSTAQRLHILFTCASATSCKIRRLRTGTGRRTIGQGAIRQTTGGAGSLSAFTRIVPTILCGPFQIPPTLSAGPGSIAQTPLCVSIVTRPNRASNSHTPTHTFCYAATSAIYSFVRILPSAYGHTHRNRPWSSRSIGSKFYPCDPCSSIKYAA